jgi:hypothetical protein
MSKFADLLLRALIWALAGSVFGGLYGGLSASWQQLFDSGWLTVTLATTLAGAITAAFFGSMLTALMGAMMGVLSAVVYLVVFSSEVALLPLLVIAAGLAFLAGTLLPQGENLRTRPLGQTVSGLLAGVVAGPVTTIAIVAFDLPVQSSWSAAVAVAVVGVMFLVLSRWIAPACPDWLSSRYGAPVVAGIVAAAVASAQWLIGSSITGGSGELSNGDVEAILATIPNTLLGGAVGGALGGAGLELLGIERSDYHV